MSYIRSNQVMNFTRALKAATYDVRIIDATNQKRVPITVIYSGEQLTKPGTIRYLAGMNKERYHIYCRPVGFEYILLDDLRYEMLPELARLKPCLLIETSSGNYQSWLRLKDCPPDRETALNLCRTLAKLLKADINSAKPEQVGRLPGYTNCKSKYQMPNGYFPFVKLQKWEARYAELNPLEGPACKISPSVDMHDHLGQSTGSAGNSQSEKDFAIACQMIREGLPDLEISMRLEKNLHVPGRPRKTNSYISTTISNAREAVRKQHFDSNV